MAVFENHAGFNVSESKLQLVEINYVNDQFKLVNVDQAEFEEAINFETDKEEKIGALLQGAFNKIISIKPIQSTSVSFTLPFDLFHIVQLPYDNTLLYQDLIEEFKWELSVLYPFISTKDIVIQYFEIEKNVYNSTNSALVFGIDRKYLKMIDDFCKTNGFKLRFIDNVHIAAERSISANNSMIYKGLTLSVYIDKKILSIFFANNGKPLFLKVKPFSELSEIPQMIESELLKSDFLKVDKKQIESAFITGEDLQLSFIDSLKNHSGINFILVNPFDKIKPDFQLYENKYYLDKYNSFSSAAGIAFRLA